MNKEDWKKVIESTFNEVGTELNNNKLRVENDKIVLNDEDVETTIKLPEESKIYSINKDLEEIQIFTKNYHDVDGFTGSHIIVSKNLETCMLVDTISVNHIPWDEITVIRIIFHPNSSVSGAL